MEKRGKEKELLIKEDENNNRSKIGVKKTGIIIILASSIIILLVVIVDNSKYDNYYIDVISNTILNLAMTSVTIGAGTVLYSYFDFVEYIKRELISIVIEHKYIDRLSNMEKRQIIGRLERGMLYPNGEKRGNLYDFVNEEVHTLVGSPYYEYMNLAVSCSLNKDRIVKKIVRKFKCNYENEDDYIIDLPLMTQCYFTDKDNPEAPFFIERFLINGEDITNNIEMKTSCNMNGEKYNRLFYYGFKDDSFASANKYSKDKTIVVEMHYRTIVGFDDYMMGYRVYLPCKRFEAIFTYCECDIDVNVEIFAFKDIELRGKRLSSERIDKVDHDGVKIVKISDWILPGDGILYVIVPKVQKSC